MYIFLILVVIFILYLATKNKGISTYDIYTNGQMDFKKVDNLYPEEINNQDRRWVYIIELTGTNYADFNAALKQKPGKDVILLPFPSEYDDKGIKVLTSEKKHIGWIPANSTMKNSIFNAMNNGSIALGKIHSVKEYDNKLYIKISVALYDKPYEYTEYDKMLDDLKEASIYEKEKNIDKALDIYNNLIEKEMKHYKPYLRMAIYYKKQKEIENEINVLTIGIENIKKSDLDGPTKDSYNKYLEERLSKLVMKNIND